MSREEFIAGYKDFYGDFYYRAGAEWCSYVCNPSQATLFNIIRYRDSKGNEEILKELNDHFDLIESPLYQALK